MLRGSMCAVAVGLIATAAISGCGDDVGSDAGLDAGLDGGRSDAAEDGGADAGMDAGPAVAWYEDAVLYEIFVRSFVDSDGDGIGDLAGLTSKLDYLNDGDPGTDTDLGVDGVWLMPINPSPSYHGYDVTDYRAVRPEYGDMADLDALIREAHARGIHVILDLVINHSSSQHPWFVSSQQGPGAMYRDYYSWRTDDPGWTAPPGLGPDLWHPLGGEYYYGIFWSGMPDLNHANEAVYQEVLSTCRFWLDRGVDGFRLDAVRYLFENEQGEVADLPETHAYFKRLRADLEPDYPNALLVAEAWSSTNRIAPYYGEGDEFQLAFSFGVSQGIQDSARMKDAARLKTQLQEADRYFSDRSFEAPFITNHDMSRLLRDRNVDEASYRVAVATLFALPGTPFVYYGEEIGMEGGSSERDEDKRTPFRWTAEAPNYGFTTGTPWIDKPEAVGVDVASQQVDSNSLWWHFSRLIRHRKEDAVWNLGGSRLVGTQNAGVGVVAFVREHDGRSGLFVANFATEMSPVFTVEVGGAPVLGLASSASIVVRLEGERVQVEGLEANGFAYIDL